MRRHALREIEALGEDPFDTQTLIAGETSPGEWLAAASTVPFLSEKRTVIVRNLLRAGSPSDALSDAHKALAALPPSARLVLVADEESTSDYERQRRLDSWRGQWETAVKKSGGLVLDFKIDANNLKTELNRYAEELGKKLPPPAAETLLEMTGRNLSRAMEELEKVALYVGDNPAIATEDVVEAALPSREWNVFKLVDSIVEGSAGQALSQLRALIGSGTKAESAAMQNIFPNLSRNLRLIWQAKVCLDHRADPAKPSPEVAELLPDQGSIASANDWQRRKALGAARKLTLPQIAECLEILARTDARLKGLESSFSASDALERMVLEMVDVVRQPATTRRM